MVGSVEASFCERGLHGMLFPFLTSRLSKEDSRDDQVVLFFHVGFASAGEGIFQVLCRFVFE